MVAGFRPAADVHCHGGACTEGPPGDCRSPLGRCYCFARFPTSLPAGPDPRRAGWDWGGDAVGGEGMNTKVGHAYGVTFPGSRHAQSVTYSL